MIAGVISRLRHFPNVHFIIGGDGPKRGLLEEVREKSNMQNRVTMLGPLEHAKVSKNSILHDLDFTIFQLTHVWLFLLKFLLC